MLCGCDINNGYKLIQMSEDFKLKNNDLTRNQITYFEPEVNTYFIREDVNLKYFESLKIKNNLSNMINRISNKNNLKTTFINVGQFENPEVYVNHLLPLRNELKSTLELQDHELNETRFQKYSKGYSQKVFVYPPILKPVSAKVEDVLGSPYVGYFGLLAVDSKPKNRKTRLLTMSNSELRAGTYFYIYHILMDARSGEVVYRELKKYNTPPKAKYLKAAIYDSYYTLNKNLSK